VHPAVSCKAYRDCPDPVRTEAASLVSARRVDGPEALGKALIPTRRTTSAHRAPKDVSREKALRG